jgi:hypothetical protein
MSSAQFVGGSGSTAQFVGSGSTARFVGGSSGGGSVVPGPTPGPTPGPAINTTFDFGPALVASFAGVASGAPGANVWAASAACNGATALAHRAAAGPILGPDAVTIADSVPAYILETSTPLVVVRSSNPNPPQSLVPLQTATGFSAWYWVSTQFEDAGGAPVGIVLLLMQVLVGPGKAAKCRGCAPVGPVSVWMLYGGASLNGVWHTFPTTYLDDSQVTATPTGVVVTSPGAVASFSVVVGDGAGGSVGGGVPAPGFAGGSFDVSVVLADGTALHLAGSTARGPTYEQAGANVATSGPFQTAYWSIVDGVPSTVATLSLPGKAPVVAVGPNRWLWLDNQQFGLQRVGGAAQFASALMGSSLTAFSWLWTIVQTPDVQLNAFLAAGKPLQRFLAGQSVAAVECSMWETGKPARHGLKATITLGATYPGTSIPSAIAIEVEGRTWVLQSLVANPPNMRSDTSTTFESPSRVQLDGVPVPNGVGVIEWQHGATTLEAVKATTGLPASYGKAYDPSVTAALLIVAVGLAVVVIGVGAALGVARAAKPTK